MRGTNPRAVTSGSVKAPKAGRWGVRVGLAVVGVAATSLALMVPAQAEPLWPGGPDIGTPAIIPSPAPSIEPGTGATVGGKRAIDIFYKVPTSDRVAAQNAVRVTSNPGVAGTFKWIDNQHLQWYPNDYWPRGTNVTVNVPGASSNFRVSDTFDAVGSTGGHDFEVKIGGDVVRTFPASFGKPKHETPTGSFPVMELDRNIIMDSSTYGVPVNSPEGYKLNVEYAVRLTWSGIFVHSAPWSTAQQGNSNVSHGCINLAPAAAQWFFENVRPGDVVNITG